MCGIAGIADRNNLESAVKMADLFSYRGPDDSGEYIDPEAGVALAMRRLSIIDLSGGHQPMTNEDNSIWVVCNGEIYNSPDLRKYLLTKGHKFKTVNSDIEVLLHLYEEKGEALVNDLIGMYAFVIYDKRKSKLIGVRDRVGIKPLYFSAKGTAFAFSSELKSLLLLPWVSKEINANSLYHYVSLQYVPAPDSIFADIKKLAAGSYFVYNLSSRELIVKPYWKLNLNNQENRSVDEWVCLVKNKIIDVVKRWTLSDVPIACSLSGGLDSAAIVAVIARLGFRGINTYTLGFKAESDQEFSELSLAKQAAKKYGTKHHEIVIDPERILVDLEKMVWHLDEPYGGGLPSWYIYELIGKDVKVALTGTGGDELFSNYGKYLPYERSVCQRYASSVKKAVRYNRFNEISNQFNHPHGYLYQRYFTDAAKDAVVFSDTAAIELKTEALLENKWMQSETKEPRNATAFLDFELQLPEEFLQVTDRFSMAHSVEARTPLLDHELIELVYQMPAELRTGGNEHKGFMKRIIRDLVPQELINAPKKGFVLPLTRWTRQDMKAKIEESLSPVALKGNGLFSTKLYEEVVKPHMAEKADYTQQIWTLFMFQLWHNTFMSS